MRVFKTLTSVSATLVLCSGFAVFAQTTVPKTAPAEPPAMKAPQQAAPVGGSIIQSGVFFEFPKDGATVPGEFTAKVAVRGPKTAKAGEAVPGQGHHHIIIDSFPVAKGEQIPMDEKHIHLLEGQTEAKLKLPKGEHTLTLQFGDGTHKSYGETMSQTIRVKVK